MLYKGRALDPNAIVSQPGAQVVTIRFSGNEALIDRRLQQPLDIINPRSTSGNEPFVIAIIELLV
jgi:hypothetical protein